MGADIRWWCAVVCVGEECVSNEDYSYNVRGLGEYEKRSKV